MRGVHQAVAVLVLEPLAVERGAAGRGAQHEAAAPGVAEGPELVAGALEAEHRVEDVEGDHGLAVRGVGRAGGLHGGRRARLGEALLEDLAGLVLAVGEDEVGVDRVVELAQRGVDADLLEERVHAEGARLVGDDGHHAPAHDRVAQQVPQQLGEGHRRRDLLAAGAVLELAEDGVARRGQRLLQHDAARRGAAQRRAALLQVLDLRRVGPGVVVGRVLELSRRGWAAPGGRGRRAAPAR